MIKEGRRRRYIGFVISSDKDLNISKNDFIDKIKEQCKKKYDKHPRDLGITVIRFKKDRGIVRCKHTEKEKTIKILTSISTILSQKIQIKTIATSGTIKALINKNIQIFK